MLNRATAINSLLLIALAGCASNPRYSRHVPDWESEEVQSAKTVAPPTPLSPPTTAPQESNSVSPTASLKPVAPPPRHASAETWIPLNRWSQENGLGPPLRLPETPMPAYAIKSSGGTLTLHAKSQTAQFDRLELRLGFAPQMIDGQLYLHTLDLDKTVQPLLFTNCKTQQQNYHLIVIDPGHGGENAGAKSVLGNRYEKEFTLDWARRLASLLVSNGWQVFLTRTNDSDLALSNRVAFAEEHKADLFLSLHFNSSAPSEEQAGLETYCLTPMGMPSTVTRGYSDEVGTAFPNNAFDAQNFRLALDVHRALLAVNGAHDRGVRRARFPGVLRGQQRPAILIEGGYLSNPHEAAMISDPAYRQKLAGAVAKAIGTREGSEQASEVSNQRAETRTKSSL